MIYLNDISNIMIRTRADIGFECYNMFWTLGHEPRSSVKN